MKKFIVIFCIIFYAVFAVKRIASYVNKIDEKANDTEFTQDYKKCDAQFEDRKYSNAIECYSNVLSKYDRDDMNFVRYNYALALANYQEYERAKQELEYVIENEEANTKLAIDAKEILKEVSKDIKKNKKTYTREQTKRMDIGDYYSDLEKIITWRNPAGITVYIEEDENQEIFKKAFDYWDKNLLNMINFVYKNDGQVNITACFKDAYDETDGWCEKMKQPTAGCTSYSYYIIKGKNYFRHAKITVLRHDPMNRKYTKDELYSIILHEIGHAIGLSGHSKSKGDIMFFSTATYLNGEGIISNRDKNTVKKIYGNI